MTRGGAFFCLWLLRTIGLQVVSVKCTNRSLALAVRTITYLRPCALTDSHTPGTDLATAPSSGDTPKIQEPRLWRGDGWTASVIKNEDDDGWAVAMTKDGAAEPALIGPWTMGRDKKNPKPLDGIAFSTLVKTAHEFVRRQEQQQHAALHQSIEVTAHSKRITVSLDIVPDEDNPYALLSAQDDVGEELAKLRVAASFKLNRASAVAWVESSFAKPVAR
jgi:hypothetical protein